MKTTINTFFEGAIGAIAGIVASLYFSDNLSMAAICGGFGAIIGRHIIPYIFDLIEGFLHDKNGLSITKVFRIFFWLFCLTGIIISSVYLTFDNLKVGETLTTKTRVKLKKEPGVGEEVIKILLMDEKVKYIEKYWKRTRWNESGNKYHNFWRKVETKNGEIGWIYGAYLK